MVPQGEALRQAVESGCFALSIILISSAYSAFQIAAIKVPALFTLSIFHLPTIDCGPQSIVPNILSWNFETVPW
jgi:hypothetical protein